MHHRLHWISHLKSTSVDASLCDRGSSVAVIDDVLPSAKHAFELSSEAWHDTIDLVLPACYRPPGPCPPLPTFDHVDPPPRPKSQYRRAIDHILHHRYQFTSDPPLFLKSCSPTLLATTSEGWILKSSSYPSVEEDGRGGPRRENAEAGDTYSLLMRGRTVWFAWRRDVHHRGDRSSVTSCSVVCKNGAKCRYRSSINVSTPQGTSLSSPTCTDACSYQAPIAVCKHRNPEPRNHNPQKPKYQLLKSDERIFFTSVMQKVKGHEKEGHRSTLSDFVEI